MLYAPGLSLTVWCLYNFRLGCSLLVSCWSAPPGSLIKGAVCLFTLSRAYDGGMPVLTRREPNRGHCSSAVSRSSPKQIYVAPLQRAVSASTLLLAVSVLFLDYDPRFRVEITQQSSSRALCSRLPFPRLVLSRGLGRSATR